VRYLAVDLGAKRTGLAAGDDVVRIVQPVEVVQVPRGPALLDALARAVDRHGPDELVVGLPLNMDGTEGAGAKTCRALGRNLLRLRPDLLVTFQDERLSTAAVERTLIGEADLSRGKRAGVVDRAAAAWILDAALDRLRNAGT